MWSFPLFCCPFILCSPAAAICDPFPRHPLAASVLTGAVFFQEFKYWDTNGLVLASALFRTMLLLLLLLRRVAPVAGPLSTFPRQGAAV